MGPSPVGNFCEVPKPQVQRGRVGLRSSVSSVAALTPAGMSPLLNSESCVAFEGKQVCGFSSLLARVRCLRTATENHVNDSPAYLAVGRLFERAKTIFHCPFYVLGGREGDRLTQYRAVSQPLQIISGRSFVLSAMQESHLYFSQRRGFGFDSVMPNVDCTEDMALRKDKGRGTDLSLLA